MTVIDPGFDYYIDATGGLDTNGGQSSGDAWQTLNKANDAPTGSSIGWKFGEIYTCEDFSEFLSMLAADSLGAYGEDTLELPTIRNSVDITGETWAQHGTYPRIYSINWAGDTPRAVWHQTQYYLASVASVAAMIPGSWYWESGTTTLYVWLWNGKEPTASTDDVYLVVSAYGILISGAGCSIDSLKFVHGDAGNVFINAATCEISNCEFRHNLVGVQVSANGDSANIHDNKFVDNWSGTTYAEDTGYKDGNTGNAIKFGGADDCTVKNNVFVANYLDYSSNGDPERLNWVGNLHLYPALSGFNYAAGGTYPDHTGSDHVVVRRNVIVHDPNRYAYGTKNGHGIVWQIQTDWLRVERNVVVMDYQGMGGPTALSVNTSGPYTADNSLADYNCYYKTPECQGDPCFLFARDSSNATDAIASHRTNCSNENIAGIAVSGSPEGASVVEDPGLTANYLPASTSIYDGDAEWWGNAHTAADIPESVYSAGVSLADNLFDEGDFTDIGTEYTNDGGWYWDTEAGGITNGLLHFEKVNGTSYWSHPNLPTLNKGTNYRIRLRIMPWTNTSPAGAYWRISNIGSTKWLTNSWQLNQYGEDVDLVVRPDEDITLARFWGADGYDAFQIRGLSIIETADALTAPNALYLYKGAVEPPESGGSGNQHVAWKGAIEPVGVLGGGTLGPVRKPGFLDIDNGRNRRENRYSRDQSNDTSYRLGDDDSPNINTYDNKRRNRYS